MASLNRTSGCSTIATVESGRKYTALPEGRHHRHRLRHLVFRNVQVPQRGDEILGDAVEVKRAEVLVQYQVLVRVEDVLPRILVPLRGAQGAYIRPSFIHSSPLSFPADL